MIPRPTTKATIDCNPTTILLFGEVLADVFSEYSVLGGAPFNVARHLQSFAQDFALRPLLISRAGNDALRTRLFASMREYGMDIRYIQLDPLRPTGKVHVHMTADGHHFEILDEQAYDYIDAQQAHTSLYTNPKCIYFGTLAQRNAVSRLAIDTLLMSAASMQVQAIKFLDINLRDPWYTVDILRRSLRYADIVKMNEDELLVLAKLLALPGDGLQAQALGLLQQFELQALVVTAGAEGAWQVARDGVIQHADVLGTGGGIAEDTALQQAALVDTVGAGDAFTAAYLLGILSGWTVSQQLSRAHCFARAMCTQFGAVPESADFYLPFQRHWLKQQ